MVHNEGDHRRSPHRLPAPVEDFELSAALTAVGLIRIFVEASGEDLDENSAIMKALDLLKESPFRLREWGRDGLMVLLHQLTRHAANGAIAAFDGAEAAMSELQDPQDRVEHDPRPVLIALIRLCVQENPESPAPAPCQPSNAHRTRAGFIVDRFMRPYAEGEDALGLIVNAARIASHLLLMAEDHDPQAAVWVARYLDEHVDSLMLFEARLGVRVPDYPEQLD